MKRTRIKTKGKRRFKGPEYEDPEYLKKIAGLPCAVSTTHGCSGDVVAHHVKTKGAGGKDRGDTIPLCYLHHQEWHNRGRISFQMKYGIDAPKEAGLLAERFSDTVLPNVP